MSTAEDNAILKMDGAAFLNQVLQWLDVLAEQRANRQLMEIELAARDGLARMISVSDATLVNAEIRDSFRTA